MNYRLTDRRTMMHALERVKGKQGRRGSALVTVLSVDADDTVSEEIVIKTDSDAGEALTFTFKDNLLKLHLQPVAEHAYRLKEIVIEPVSRQAARIESRLAATEVLGAPPVDIASSIALYGKTSSIAQTCQMGRMHLMGYLNGRGFMISDCEIGFYYSSEQDLFQRLEENGTHMFVIDALKRAIHSAPGYEHPLVGLAESKHEAFFTRYARDKMRSHYVYTFRDQVGTVMGYVDMRSPMPGLGHSHLKNEEHRDQTLKLFESYLFEQCIDFVFQMEMFSVKQWVRLGNAEELVDLSENGRGARLVIRAKETERVLRQGAKVRFTLTIGGTPHSYTATVRSIKPVEAGFSVGLRIHRGSREDSLAALAGYARAQIPSLAS